jgi:hypothetical protein
MPVVLPYRFDTSQTVQLILKGVAGLLLLVTAGLLYSLLISRDRVAALQLFLVTLILLYFGRLFLKNLQTSRGTIVSGEVIAEPVLLYGVRLQCPEGCFPLRQFQAVRVERISPPMFAQGGPHERVSLLGKEGTPDILIARTSDDEGRAMGRELAAALGLPYKEEGAPY